VRGFGVRARTKVSLLCNILDLFFAVDINGVIIRGSFVTVERRVAPGLLSARVFSIVAASR